MSERAATIQPSRLRSECGLYHAVRAAGDGPMYDLYDTDGRLLGRSNYWSNCSSNTRIAFETGFGEIRARFSYPRYPRWFRRRWVHCVDIGLEKLAELIQSFGCEVIVGYKPSLNLWCHVGFRATGSQLGGLEAEWVRRGIRWNGPPRKRAQWDIQCPGSHDRYERGLEHV